MLLLSKNLSLIASCILATVLAVGAQTQKGSISGQVIDTYGALVPGAEVRLEQAPAKTVLPTIRKTNTDTEGRFAFSGLDPGRYELHVKVSWFYRVTSKIVELAENQFAPLNMIVSLEPCSDELDSSLREKLSEADHAEITRILIDGLIEGHRTESSIEGKIMLIP